MPDTRRTQTINPESASPGDLYKLLIGSVLPRPIAFVSTLSPAGVRNLSPFSFFTVVSANPPIVYFCPIVSSTGKAKDTLTNIRATKEFVVNVVSEDFLPQMNQCSAEFPPEIDEFTESGLTAIPSQIVQPPRVAESHIHMECVLHQIVEVSSNPQGGSLVLGEVKLFHVADHLLHNFNRSREAPGSRPHGRLHLRPHYRSLRRHTPPIGFLLSVFIGVYLCRLIVLRPEAPVYHPHARHPHHRRQITAQHIARVMHSQIDAR